MRRRWLVAVAVGAAVLAGCSGGTRAGAPASPPPTTVVPATSSTPPPTTVAPATSSTPARRASVTKVLVVVVENHSLDEMRREMRWTFGLAQKYGYATRSTALTHPSLPNYLAMVGGDRFGVTSDVHPDQHPVHGPSVFGQALARGRTARVYADGMAEACQRTDGGDRYAAKHNPWTYFVDETEQCRVDDVGLDRLAPDADAGALPDAGMIVPNLCHDAHDPDCTLGAADEWMKVHVGHVLTGPDFRSGRLVVVITADEDDHTQDNTVLTVVLHPSQHAHVVDAELTSYSITRLYDDVLGAPRLRAAATAPDLAKAFGLPLHAG